MAYIEEPTPELLLQWEKWKEGRPPKVQDLATLFVPWRLYLYKPTNHRVVVCAYGEDGTMHIAVLGKFNAVQVERRVFGIKPEDLEECDLPGPDEVLGVEHSPGSQGELDLINRVRKGNGLPALTREELSARTKHTFEED